MRVEAVRQEVPLYYGVDDEVVCTACDFEGLVRAGQDDCPECGEECLMWGRSQHE